MSAILADARAIRYREQYRSSGAGARVAREARPYRCTARFQPNGRPYYFMGVGTDQNILEEYDEHIGESAYLIGMAWHYSGKTDSELRGAADALVSLLGSDGTAPHVRSFNWQCRSAIAAPWFLR